MVPYRVRGQSSGRLRLIQGSASQPAFKMLRMLVAAADLR